MKDMESEKFDESWKDAFDKAEVTPSDGVWTNIELDLEKAKGGDLKRRVMFYQMVAAASVIFAMAIGGAGYYFNFKAGNTSVNQLAHEQAAENEGTDALRPSPSGQLPQAADVSSHNGTRKAGSSDLQNPAAKNHKETEGTSPAAKERRTSPVRDNSRSYALSNTTRSPSAISDDQSKFLNPSANHTLLAAKQAEEPLVLPHGIDERSLPPIYTPRQISLTIPDDKKQVDPVVAMLAKLDQREREVQAEEREKRESATDENLWTSIGFAAGSFNNVQGSVASPSPANYSTAMALAAPIVDQETKASGYSYSMGVNVGTRISERWVLQGGVNYLTHSSDYTAHNVVVSSGLPQQQRFRAATPNEVLNIDDLSSKLAYSAPYNVNNSMRYLSIPMQAGYLLVNKTFGLQLNAGIATDVFLQNTIKADSDQLDKTSQPGGADSPYRSVNLSGLVGTELSYRFNENYRISLNPGIRYPLNTIYKSEFGVQSTPLTIDIGLRFRYIFH